MSGARLHPFWVQGLLAILTGLQLQAPALAPARGAPSGILKVPRLASLTPLTAPYSLLAPPGAVPPPVPDRLVRASGTGSRAGSQAAAGAAVPRAAPPPAAPAAPCPLPSRARRFDVAQVFLTDYKPANSSDFLFTMGDPVTQARQSRAPTPSLFFVAARWHALYYGFGRHACAAGTAALGSGMAVSVLGRQAPPPAPCSALPPASPHCLVHPDSLQQQQPRLTTTRAGLPPHPPTPHTRPPHLPRCR